MGSKKWNRNCHYERRPTYSVRKTGIKVRGLCGHRDLLIRKISHAKKRDSLVCPQHSLPSRNQFLPRTKRQKPQRHSPRQPQPIHSLQKRVALGCSGQCLSTPASPWSQLIAPWWDAPHRRIILPRGRHSRIEFRGVHARHGQLVRLHMRFPKEAIYV